MAFLLDGKMCNLQRWVIFSLIDLTCAEIVSIMSRDIDIQSSEGGRALIEQLLIRPEEGVDQ